MFQSSLENDRGFISHFGASALVGNEVLYLDAFNHLINLTSVFKDYFNYTTLAFTPIPESQVQAGRAKRGNIISLPRGGFAAVQISKSFKAGVTAIPPAVQTAIDLLFEQCIPPSPGLPLCSALNVSVFLMIDVLYSDLGESDAQQKVFESYGDYELLKQIYAKYDPTRFNLEHTQGPIGL
ncbi:hypothetical protein B0H19DRAFT_1374386 [Mycena capillaripes]|nr:hypothetical protein B0H19DRAFT_1374386 [Mycena capillaripes]